MARTIEELEAILNRYEENGPAKLYYALNRKAWEMADMLNSSNLKNIEIDDPKSKTFDRLLKIINDSASVSAAVKILGEVAGITGSEEKDVATSRTKITPESIANVLSNNGRQQP